MSIKTDISEIRRKIASNSTNPVEALNRITNIFSELLLKLPSDSVSACVSDVWSKYHNMATSRTIATNNYGHNQQWFDANIQAMGDLLIILDKKLKKSKKNPLTSTE